MKKISKKELNRKYRHLRIRKKVVGLPDKPRLCVHRSLKNMNALVVNDSEGKILLGLSTMSKDVRSKLKKGGNIEGATTFGELFAVEAQKKGIKKVCFDRGGYKYHGRIKAFAEAARSGGLEF